MLGGWHEGDGERDTSETSQGDSGYVLRARVELELMEGLLRPA